MRTKEEINLEYNGICSKIGHLETQNLSNTEKIQVHKLEALALISEWDKAPSEKDIAPEFLHEVKS